MLPTRATIATYGGAKEDAFPTEDPVTDERAADINEMKSDVAMMGRTAVRAIRRFIGHATTPPDPSTGFVHRGLWGEAAGVKPPVAHASTGAYDIAWPSTVTDELGEEKDLLLDGGFAQVESATNFYGTSVEKTGPTTLRVRIWLIDGSPALDDAVGLPITVYAY